MTKAEFWLTERPTVDQSMLYALEAEQMNGDVKKAMRAFVDGYLAGSADEMMAFVFDLVSFTMFVRLSAPSDAETLVRRVESLLAGLWAGCGVDATEGQLRLQDLMIEARRLGMDV